MENQEITTEEIVRQKKAAHDYVATAIEILTTRVRYYHEEFEGTHQTVQFLKNFRAQIEADITKLEPKKEEEPKVAAPYNMDLSHVKGE